MDMAQSEGKAVWTQPSPPLYSAAVFSGSLGVIHLQWPSHAAHCGDPAAIPSPLPRAAYSCPGSREQAGLMPTASTIIFGGGNELAQEGHLQVTTPHLQVTGKVRELFGTCWEV